MMPQRMSARQQPGSGTLSNIASGHMALGSPVMSGARHFLVWAACRPHVSWGVQQMSPTRLHIVVPHAQPSSTMLSQSLSLLSPQIS